MEFVSRIHIQQSENFRAVKDGRNKENKKKVPEREKRGTETYKKRWAGPPLHNCSLWPFCSNHTISRANGFSELEVCVRWSAHAFKVFFIMAWIPSSCLQGTLRSFSSRVGTRIFSHPDYNKLYSLLSHHGLPSNSSASLSSPHALFPSASTVTFSTSGPFGD